ncbi:MAG: malate synthase A [Gemmatimonadetes bacterium]|nr:malate synthase A [Gemmatimonadota bacterium]
MIETKSVGIEVRGGWSKAAERILTPPALAFVGALHREFEERRGTLLEARARRQLLVDAGERPDFLRETTDIREADWQVAPAPIDLERRWVEISGPADRRMIINALNSGADCFTADLEDSLSPTWRNVVHGQLNLYDAVRRQIDFTAPDGKTYWLGPSLATLQVRPRGWHLAEDRVRVDGRSVSASLFDFGLYFFHNAVELIERGSGPYFYLPKLQSYLEARLWDDVFTFAQRRLGVPHGTIRATVTVEHVLAAFEMNEILYELRDHSAGLALGRADYVFSAIKTFAEDDAAVLPDRGSLRMSVPFMRSYAELLLQTCHRRGAHAIGGNAQFIPNPRDERLTERALSSVRQEKTREGRQGFDGTIVTHPALVPLARAAFAETLGVHDHQRDRTLDDVYVSAADLLETSSAGCRMTRIGFELNVSVALQYLTAWLRGSGAVAIYSRVEEKAAAELARAQVWQWIRHGVELEDGTRVTAELYREVRAREVARLKPRVGAADGRLRQAAELLDAFVLSRTFAPFLQAGGAPAA